MESKPKNILVRIACYEGNLSVDPSGKAKGRGVYLCPSQECMEKARKLILNTDLKIGAIAEMVGYGSTKHFTRIYKEKFGTTPNADR